MQDLNTRLILINNQLEQLKNTIQTKTNIPKTSQDSRFLALNSLQNALGSYANLNNAIFDSLIKHNTRNGMFNEKAYLNDMKTLSNLNITNKRIINFLNIALVSNIYSILNNLFYHLEKDISGKAYNNLNLMQLSRNVLTETQQKGLKFFEALYYLNESFLTNFIHTKETNLNLNPEINLIFIKDKPVTFNMDTLLNLIDEIAIIIGNVFNSKELIEDPEVIKDSFASNNL